MHRAGKLAAASAIYAFFSAYLFYPYLSSFSRFDYLVIINTITAAIGCYILSRRWVASWAGSFLAGVIYGFGPFFLSLGNFHPTAGSIAAIVPWSFLPAVYFGRAKWQWFRIPLSALPFFVIAAAFKAANMANFNPVRMQIVIGKYELTSILACCVPTNKAQILPGVYHAPVAALFIGMVMLIMSRRYSVMITLAIGLILSLSRAVFEVTPFFWLVIPVLCLSVITGEGFDGLISCGYKDRKWILASGIIVLVGAVTCLMMGTKYAFVIAGLADKYVRLFRQAAVMYIIAAVAVGAIFFLAKGKARLKWIRLGIISSAMVVDIFLSARYIVDHVL